MLLMMCRFVVIFLLFAVWNLLYYFIKKSDIIYFSSKECHCFNIIPSALPAVCRMEPHPHWWTGPGLSPRWPRGREGRPSAVREGPPLTLIPTHTTRQRLCRHHGMYTTYFINLPQAPSNSNPNPPPPKKKFSIHTCRMMLSLRTNIS